MAAYEWFPDEAAAEETRRSVSSSRPAPRPDQSSTADNRRLGVGGLALGASAKRSVSRAPPSTATFPTSRRSSRPWRAEGFRTFRLALVDAWERRGAARQGDGRGLFAVLYQGTHSSYRLAFCVKSCARDPELIEKTEAAFHALVDALMEGQREGWVRQDDPLMLARFVCDTRKIAMLVIDGQLRDGDESGIALNRYAVGAESEPPSQVRRGDPDSAGLTGVRCRW